MAPPNQPLPTDYQAVIRSPPETVNDAHDFLEDVWRERPDVTDAERMAVATILSELVTNVIQNNPHREVFCQVNVRIEDDLFVVETSDTGDRTTVEPTANPMPGADAERGRGLPLINLLADTVEHHWKDDRNLWTVTRAR